MGDPCEYGSTKWPCAGNYRFEGWNLPIWYVKFYFVHHTECSVLPFVSTNRWKLFREIMALGFKNNIAQINIVCGENAGFVVWNMAMYMFTTGLQGAVEEIHTNRPSYRRMVQILRDVFKQCRVPSSVVESFITSVTPKHFLTSRPNFHMTHLGWNGVLP